MKNYKILASILLLSLLMFITGAVYAASFGASTLTVNKTKIEADNTERVKFKVKIKDASGNTETGATIYAASDRDCDAFYEKGEEIAKNPVVDGGYYYSFTDNDEDGEIEFEVSSNIAGEVEIGVGFNNQVFRYLTRDDVSVGEAQIIATKTVEFEVTEIEIVKLVEIYDYVIDGPDGEPGDYTYQTEASDEYVMADNTDYYELTFMVTNAGGDAISGAEVNYTMNQVCTRVEYDSNITDEDGEVKVRVYSCEAFTRGKAPVSEFELQAESEDKKATVLLNFDSLDPAEIYVSMASELNMYVAKEQEDKEVSFYIRDKNENYVKYSSDEALLEDLEMEILQKPEDSEMEENEDFILATSSMSEKIYLNIPAFDEEGTYLLKLSLNHINGDDAEKVFSFVVKEQGEITELKLEYPENTVALGSTTDIPEIIRVDAEGFEYELSEDDIANAIIFGASPADKVVEISDAGQITVTDDEDYTGEFTVTVIDTEESLNATWVLNVLGKPKGIKLVPPTSAVPGEVVDVSIQVIDTNEKVVALGQDLKRGYPKVTNFIVLEKPEGASVSTDDGSMFYTKLREDGKANLEIGCDKEGIVKLGVILDVKYNDNTLVSYYDEVEIDFSNKESAFTEEVKLLIGIPAYYVDNEMKMMDSAPFIEAGRTYVPLRCMAEVFGAEISWEQETQKITLDNGKRTVTLKIGSNLVQSSNSPTVMCDGVPQIVDGRTYVPFRIIGEVFGAYVEPITDDNDSVIGVKVTMEEDE